MGKNILVKEPFIDDDLTEELVKEVIKCAQDPIYFIRQYCKVQHPTKGSVAFELYPYQERVINEILDKNQVLAMFPRQSGKTTCVVGYLLWEACFTPDITIGVAAHKGSGAKEIISRLKYAYEQLPMWLKPGAVVYNVFEIVFDNNSKIISSTTTESTFRGQSISVCYLDELSHVPPKIADAFWTSLRPALSAGGLDGKGIRLIITSTPNGSEGLFADLWFKSETGDSGLSPIRIDNKEVPGREDEEAFKREMLKTMSLQKFNQEFLCHWISDKGTLIASQVLEAIKPVPPISTHLDIELFVESLYGHRMAISVDVGEGIGQDNSVIEILDIDRMEQVGEYRDNTSNQTELAKKIVTTLQYLYDEGATELYYTIEANPIGKGVISLMDNMNAKILQDATLISDYRAKHRGILTTNKSKLAGCGRLKDLVEAGKLKLRSKRLLSELKFFVKSGASFKAESGKNDDHVMAMVVMMNLLEEMSHMDEVVDENINTLTDIDIEDGEGISDPLPVVF